MDDVNGSKIDCSPNRLVRRQLTTPTASLKTLKDPCLDDLSLARTMSQLAVDAPFERPSTAPGPQGGLDAGFHRLKKAPSVAILPVDPLPPPSHNPLPPSSPTS